MPRGQEREVGFCGAKGTEKNGARRQRALTTDSSTDEKTEAQRGMTSSFCPAVSYISEIASASIFSADKENQCLDLQKLKHFWAIFSPNTILSKGRKFYLT